MQSTFFVVNKDEWDTKEGRGKSMKNALHVQWYGKRHLSGWSDIEQRKNRSLSHFWVMRIWRHQAGRQAGRQAGSQSENSVKLKFCSNLLKCFGSIWRLFWAWFYLTNTATLPCERSEAGFWVIFFRGPCPNLGGPYYTVLSYCIIRVFLS